MTKSILDVKNAHYTLCQQLDSIADVAGVPVSLLNQSMREFCTKEEVEYVIHLFQHDDAGAIYVGHTDDVMVKMMAITGACVRNFIDARVRMLHDVLKGIKGDNPIDSRVVLIPNFCIGNSDRGIADWESTHLFGWLQDRAFSKKPTFLGVSDFVHVEKRLGSLVANFIKNNYTRF